MLLTDLWAVTVVIDLNFKCRYSAIIFILLSMQKKIDGQTKEANSKEMKPKKESKKKTKNEATDDEFERKEYLIETVTSSLCLFKDDDLCSAPGIGLCSLLKRQRVI